MMAAFNKQGVAVKKICFLLANNLAETAELIKKSYKNNGANSSVQWLIKDNLF